MACTALSQSVSKSARTIVVSQGRLTLRPLPRCTHQLRAAQFSSFRRPLRARLPGARAGVTEGLCNSLVSGS